MSDDVKVTVTLPKEIVERIRRLAAENQTSLADTVIESINLNEAMSRSEQARAKIIIQQPDGAATQLVRVRRDARL